MIANIVILLLVILAAYFIYMQVGKAWNGAPLAIAGIILILIVVGVGLWLFRGRTGLTGSQYSGRHYYVVRHAYKPYKPGGMVAFVYRRQPSI